MQKARAGKEAVSLAYQGNIVDLWEKLVEKNIRSKMGPTRPPCIIPGPGGIILQAQPEESQ